MKRSTAAWSALACCLLVACGPSGNGGAAPETTQPEAMLDWQGHRGARGLAPENTVPAFLRALEYPVTTLELDLAVSADSQLIVSHEPWMSSRICRLPDGREVAEAAETEHALLALTAAEIRDYDCGSRQHPDFPDQVPEPAHKPTLAEVVNAVQAHCSETGRALPRYNIEIKSQPDWDGRLTPEPATFARLVVDELERLGIRDSSCVQSFDFRTLRAVHDQDPGLVTAMLVANTRGLRGNLEDLGYRPEIYSPYFRLVSAAVVDSAHAEGMRIVPWTVNEVSEMVTLLDMGVDGIITDYPNRISAASKASRISK